MSQISMEEKLSDLKKVILELSKAGCSLVSENERQSELLIEKDKHISDLQEQVNRLYADNNATMESNTDLQRQIEVLWNDNDKLKNDVKKLEDDNRKLNRKIYDYEEAKKSRKSELQTKLNFAEEENKNLKIENYTLKRQLENQEQMRKNLIRLMNQLEEVKKSVDGLKYKGDNISENVERYVNPITKSDETTEGCNGNENQNVMFKASEPTKQVNDNIQTSDPIQSQTSSGFDDTTNNNTNSNEELKYNGNENSEPPIMVGGMD